MKKIIVSIIICVILIIFVFFIYNFMNKKGGEDMEEKQRPYQGPVRPTDDEEHFRKTGETKPLEENK